MKSSILHFSDLEFFLVISPVIRLLCPCYLPVNFQILKYIKNKNNKIKINITKTYEIDLLRFFDHGIIGVSKHNITTV
jgi:hypothetical protein